MKEIKGFLNGKVTTVLVPDNCQHPQIVPAPDCHAIHPSHPECDCRWCVFNKEFHKAGK